MRVCDVRSICFACVLCFKQKTAYEMRISDWSSDVCSSDLAAFLDLLAELGIGERLSRGLRRAAEHRGDEEHGEQDAAPDHHALHPGVALRFLEIGRASCRERV